MRRIQIVFLLALFSASLQAQSIGHIRYGDRIFSTGLPVYNDDGPWLTEGLPMMSRERLQKALECVEKTFGKVKEYKEYYGECCGHHHLSVTLVTDELVDFEDGILADIAISTSRFTVAKEWFRGGLRVGQKPGQPVNDRVMVSARKDNPSMFDFEFLDQRDDVVRSYVLDSEGIIIRIILCYFEC